jgi:hypothetical protein
MGTTKNVFKPNKVILATQTPILYPLLDHKVLGKKEQFYCLLHKRSLSPRCKGAHSNVKEALKQTSEHYRWKRIFSLVGPRNHNALLEDRLCQKYYCYIFISFI